MARYVGRAANLRQTAGRRAESSAHVRRARVGSRRRGWPVAGRRPGGGCREDNRNWRSSRHTPCAVSRWKAGLAVPKRGGRHTECAFYFTRRQMDRLDQGPQRRLAISGRRQRDNAHDRRRSQGQSAYGSLEWSPDSKTLVAFRIEPGERKEVYLHRVVAARRRPGQAAHRSPTRCPATSSPAYELSLFDVADAKADRVQGRSRSTSARRGCAGARTASTSPIRRSTAAISASGSSRSMPARAAAAT